MRCGGSWAPRPPSRPPPPHSRAIGTTVRVRGRDGFRAVSTDLPAPSPRSPPTVVARPAVCGLGKKGRLHCLRSRNQGLPNPTIRRIQARGEEGVLLPGGWSYHKATIRPDTGRDGTSAKCGRAWARSSLMLPTAKLAIRARRAEGTGMATSTDLTPSSPPPIPVRVRFDRFD